MDNTAFFIMNAIGLISFASSGTIKALKNRLDLFGIFVVGIITALGGGIIRDTMVNRIPFAFTSYMDMTLAVITVFITLLLFKFIKFEIKSFYITIIPDAIGLAAFTTTGALVATESTLSFFGVLILSATTAIGGGVSSDVILGKIPSVLKDDYLYASCAILGGISFFASSEFLGFSMFMSSIVCISITLSIRIIAIIFNLKLPRIN